MDFMLTIVSEKNSPTLSVKMDSDAATLFAIRLMDIFADEVKFENGLVVKGRTYQQKTPRDTNLSPVTVPCHLRTCPLSPPKNRSAPSIFLHAGKPGHGLVS